MRILTIVVTSIHTIREFKSFFSEYKCFEVLDDNSIMFYSSESIMNLTLLLKINEAKELKDKLEFLIADYGKKGCHEHIDDSDYQHEITISIYNEDSIEEFDSRIQKLLMEDT
jgi:hypothetical protein